MCRRKQANSARTLKFKYSAPAVWLLMNGMSVQAKDLTVTVSCRLWRTSTRLAFLGGSCCRTGTSGSRVNSTSARMLTTHHPEIGPTPSFTVFQGCRNHPGVLRGQPPDTARKPVLLWDFNWNLIKISSFLLQVPAPTVPRMLLLMSRNSAWLRWSIRNLQM